MRGRAADIELLGAIQVKKIGDITAFEMAYDLNSIAVGGWSLEHILILDLDRLSPKGKHILLKPQANP